MDKFRLQILLEGFGRTQVYMCVFVSLYIRVLDMLSILLAGSKKIKS